MTNSTHPRPEHAREPAVTVTNTTRNGDTIVVSVQVHNTKALAQVEMFAELDLIPPLETMIERAFEEYLRTPARTARNLKKRGKKTIKTVKVVAELTPADSTADSPLSSSPAGPTGQPASARTLAGLESKGAELKLDSLGADVDRTNTGAPESVHRAIPVESSRPAAPEHAANAGEKLDLSGRRSTEAASGITGNWADCIHTSQAEKYGVHNPPNVQAGHAGTNGNSPDPFPSQRYETPEKTGLLDELWDRDSDIPI